MAYGTLSWHPSDCGNDYCDDRHWDALLEVGKFRILLRLTENVHVSFPEKWRGAAYFTEKTEDGKDAPLLPLIVGEWRASQEGAVTNLVLEVEDELRKVVELCNDLKGKTAYPLPRR